MQVKMQPHWGTCVLLLTGHHVSSRSFCAGCSCAHRHVARRPRTPQSCFIRCFRRPSSHSRHSQTILKSNCFAGTRASPAAAPSGAASQATNKPAAAAASQATNKPAAAAAAAADAAAQPKSAATPAATPPSAPATSAASTPSSDYVPVGPFSAILLYTPVAQNILLTLLLSWLPDQQSSVCNSRFVETWLALTAM